MCSYGYIYEVTDKRNGIFYVGKHSGKFNPNYFGSGTVITNIINKYGKFILSIRIIDAALNKKELNRKEISYIAAYRMVYGTNGLYNILKGGEGGMGSYCHKLNCNCNFCKTMRKEPRKHKESCRCASCCSHRGETAGKNNGMYGTHRFGEQNPMFGKRGEKCPHYGKIWISKNNKTIKINSSETKQYLKNGWAKGRGDFHG